jgi:uncharacterized protein YbcI
LVVLLQDKMTASGRRLAALGEHERLRGHRLLVHRSVEPQIRAIVERILARRTLGLISGIDTRQDIAAEVLVVRRQRPRAGRLTAAEGRSSGQRRASSRRSQISLTVG